MRRLIKLALIMAIILSFYYDSYNGLGIFAVGLLMYIIAYHGFTKANIALSIIIITAVLSLYFDSYIGLGIAAISFIAYIGFTGTPAAQYTIMGNKIYRNF